MAANLINKVKNVTQQFRILRWHLFPGQMRKELFEAYDFSDRSLKRIPEAEMFFINDLIDSGGTVIDVGANLGIYLYCLQKAGKYDRIIAFEPLPDLAKLLRRAFPGAEIFAVALSDKNTETEFHIPFLDGRLYNTRSTVESTTQYANTSRVKKIQVTLQTLDDFVLKHKVENIHFIKIDVEGHEISLLAGARKTLEIQKPALQVEIEQHLHKESIISLIQRIEDKGYKSYFFEKKEKRFRKATEFDATEYQRTAKMNTIFHVSNFLFFPSSQIELYEQRMKKIEAKFYEK